MICVPLTHHLISQDFVLLNTELTTFPRDNGAVSGESCKPSQADSLCSPASALPSRSGESCLTKLLFSFGESQLIHIQMYFVLFFSLLSSHCTIPSTVRAQAKEQRAAGSENVTPSLPMQLCCCGSAGWMLF